MRDHEGLAREIEGCPGFSSVMEPKTKISRKRHQWAGSDSAGLKKVP